eukprot:GHVU01159497.1.p1 GENE.GHVU01159497.1~~GHVU01159497.1.p1  ORF type:complete len:133 (+),score=20.19 GHVU01159497.1:129-527(+)
MFFFTPLLPVVDEDDIDSTPPPRFKIEAAPNDMPVLRSDTASRRRISFATSQGRDSGITTRGESILNFDFSHHGNNRASASRSSIKGIESLKGGRGGEPLTFHLPQCDLTVDIQIDNETEVEIPDCKPTMGL